ncbi:MAG: hypothetical protein O9353_10830, partial [Bacteroidia bacterium]|nr:hypothetical protein [Bacteroidia bacterium]
AAGEKAGDVGAASAGSGSVDLTTRFGGTDYGVNGSFAINNSKITSVSGANVTGFFTGSNASRAALVYTSPVDGAGQVSGAAAFQQTGLSAVPQ